MASRLTDPARQGFMAGEIVWKPTGGSTIKASLVRGYTFNAAHKFVSELTGAGGTLVSTVTLGSLTNDAGVADAADSVWTGVAAGAVIPHIVIYQASAVTGGADVAATAQRLICVIDTGAGLPIPPNGQSITATWAATADRIFRL